MNAIVFKLPQEFAAVYLGANAYKVKGKASGQSDPRVGNVIAIPHVDDLGTLNGAPVLHNSECVSHDLTWVIVVGQPVDHRGVGIFSKLENVFMAKQTRHDHVVVPAYYTRNVLGQLTLANLNVVGAEIDCMATQLEKALR